MDHDNNNTVFLLPQLMLMVERDSVDLPLRNAAIFAILPLFMLILVAEVLRRVVKRKVSAPITQRPEPTQFINVEGRCEKGYENVKQAF